MLVESLLITSSTSYDTLADMVLKKDAPSADDSKTIPSLQSLHVHLDNDYTASLYLWKNGLVPDHTGKLCEGRFQNKNHRVWLPCKGHYEIRIIDQTIIYQRFLLAMKYETLHSYQIFFVLKITTGSIHQDSVHCICKSILIDNGLSCLDCLVLLDMRKTMANNE